jgi:hypothetical protein
VVGPKHIYKSVGLHDTARSVLAAKGSETCGASSGCTPAFRAKALVPEEAMHTSNAISYSSKGKKGIVRRVGDTRMMRLGF